MRQSAYALGNHVQAIIELLDRKPFPEKIGCSHFGVQTNHKSLSLGFSPRGSRLLITVYHTGWTKAVVKKCKCCGHVRTIKAAKEIAADAAVHNDRMAAIVLTTGIDAAEIWNGEDGNTGISIVLNRPVPEALEAALRRGPKDSQTCENFEKWLAPVYKLDK